LEEEDEELKKDSKHKENQENTRKKKIKWIVEKKIENDKGKRRRIGIVLRMFEKKDILLKGEVLEIGKQAVVVAMVVE
jgi:putative ribosome biogenesis GTPase RsgA